MANILFTSIQEILLPKSWSNIYYVVGGKILEISNGILRITYLKRWKETIFTAQMLLTDQTI